MSLLLDTHALLWWLSRNPTLSAEARTQISDPESRVFVSAASAWEIAIKQSLGKLEAPSDLEARMEAHRFEPLPITITHALAVRWLPRHHSDPFDRLLIAQASVEDLTIVTRDRRFELYDVSTVTA